jgi:hypothetical protein
MLARVTVFSHSTLQDWKLLLLLCTGKPSLALSLAEMETVQQFGYWLCFHRQGLMVRTKTVYTTLIISSIFAFLLTKDIVFKNLHAVFKIPGLKNPFLLDWSDVMLESSESKHPAICEQ